MLIYKWSAGLLESTPFDSAYFHADNDRPSIDSVRVYRWNHFNDTESADTTRIAFFFKSDTTISLFPDGTGTDAQEDIIAWNRAIVNAAPVPGNKPAIASSTVFPDNRTFTVENLEWQTEQGQNVSEDEIFDFNTRYLAYLILKPKAGFTTCGLPVGHNFALGWLNLAGYGNNIRLNGDIYKNTTIESVNDESTVFSILFPKTYEDSYKIDTIKFNKSNGSNTALNENLKSPKAGYEVSQVKDFSSYQQGQLTNVYNDQAYKLSELNMDKELSRPAA